MRAMLLAFSLLLVGCASLSADGGFKPVQQAAEQHLGKAVQMVRTEADQTAVEQRVAELLSQPLSADAAVQIALLNNRGLQASFQELGIAEADLVQASRLPNPGFSIAKLRRGDEREIERTFSVDLAHLIALPLTRPMDSRRFAAVQTARYMRDVRATADAGAELATPQAAKDASLCATQCRKLH